MNRFALSRIRVEREKEPPARRERERERKARQSQEAVIPDLRPTRILQAVHF
jgi:hypothetical protein